MCTIKLKTRFFSLLKTLLALASASTMLVHLRVDGMPNTYASSYLTSNRWKPSCCPMKNEVCIIKDSEKPIKTKTTTNW